MAKKMVKVYTEYEDGWNGCVHAMTDYLNTSRNPETFAKRIKREISSGKYDGDYARGMSECIDEYRAMKRRNDERQIPYMAEKTGEITDEESIERQVYLLRTHHIQNAEIARVVGKTERYVQKVVKKLIEEGLLEPRKNGGNTNSKGKGRHQKAKS